MSSPPSNWPADVQYIKSPQYHTSVNTATRAYIKGEPCPSAQPHQAVNQAVVIKRISIQSHPAFGQFGLFTVKKIPPHIRILDYLGEVHTDDRPASDYDLSLYRFISEADSEVVSVGVDASKMGNQARFTNDYRGIADSPNAVFVDGRAATGELRMSVWSTKAGIKKGEEILVSYGKSFWQERTKKA